MRFGALSLCTFIGAFSQFTSVATAQVICHVIIPGPPVTASTAGTAVTNLQLFHNGNTAILTETGFNTQINTSDGGLGFFDGCRFWWLNIGTSSTSYKPLTLDLNDQQTHTWAASSGSTLASTDPASSTFLACEIDGQWVLYLQTGNDTPSATCVTTELFVRS